MGRPDVDDLPGEAEPVEPQRWIAPGGEHQLQLRGPVAHERGEPVQRVRVDEDVDVVEHQRHAAGRCGDRVDDRREEAGIPAGPLGQRQRPQRGLRRRGARAGHASSAASTPAQKRRSTLSSSSRVSQAVSSARPATQSASSRVFP